ncbi:MAG: hypothetical protein LAT53_07255 [Idiomarina sp.]|nr:hypothetical protein [Idiomarina sp.]
MIDFDTYAHDAGRFLDRERVAQARALMAEARYMSRRRLGLFRDRLEYSHEYQQMLAFTAAYLDMSGDDVLALIQFTDEQSPLEFLFSLTYLTFASHNLGPSEIDGVPIPRPDRGDDATFDAPQLHSALHAQFPIRLGDYRRDIDFVLCLGGHEMGIEIDGAAFHGDDKEIQRDLCCELCFAGYQIPLIRIQTAALTCTPFELMFHVMNHAFEKLPLDPIRPAEQEEKAYRYILTAAHDIPMLSSFVASAFDYYFRAAVVSSIKTGIVESKAPKFALFKNNRKAKSDFIAFTVTFGSMRARLEVTDNAIIVNSALNLTAQMLIQGLMVFFNQLSSKYRFRLFDMDAGVPLHLITFSQAERTASRIALVRKRRFRGGNILIDELNQIESHNRHGLMCVGEISSMDEDETYD